MKGSWRGADCTRLRSIDVGENEPIDLQRENVEIETVNLALLTNSLTAAIFFPPFLFLLPSM